MKDNQLTVALLAKLLPATQIRAMGKTRAKASLKISRTPVDGHGIPLGHGTSQSLLHGHMQP